MRRRTRTALAAVLLLATLFPVLSDLGTRTLAAGTHQTAIDREALAQDEEPTTYGPDPAEEIAELWSVSIGDGEVLEIVDGTVYVMSDSDGETRSLLAIDALTGQQRWAVPSDYLHRFEVSDGTIFATNSGLGMVYAIDAATGQLLWTRAASAEGFFYVTVVDSTVIIEDHSADLFSVVDAATGYTIWDFYGAWSLVDDVVYAGSNGTIYAIDVTTGDSFWSISVDPDVYYTAGKDTLYVRDREAGLLSAFDAATGQLRWATAMGGRIAPKASADETVYIRGADADLYALDKTTGEQRWVAPVDLDESDDYSVRLVDDAVYIHADRLYAIDAETGQQRWNSAIGADYNNTRIVDGTVYAVQRAEAGTVATPTLEEAPRTLYALDAVSGEERWAFAAGNGFAHIEQITDELIYVTNGDDTLFAIDRSTGEPRWSYPASYPIEFEPLDEGVVYLGSGDTVYAVDAVSGEPYWTFPAKSTLSWPLDVLDGVVYATTEDGTLYALGNPEAVAARAQATATAAAASAQATATAAAASAEATATAEALEAAWETYFSTELAAAVTTAVSAFPGMSASPAFEMDLGFLPAGFTRVTGFDIAIAGGASNAWAELAIFPSKADASTGMANMSGGLQRSGWQLQEVEGLSHDHACLTLVQAERSQAFCYMTRDDALILTYSSVFVPNPEAALLNAVDLASAMSDAYDEVDRPG